MSVKPFKVDPDRLLLNAEEISQVLGIGRSTIYNWTKTGRIPSVRLSERCTRYNRDAVVAALAKSYADACAPIPEASDES